MLTVLLQLPGSGFNMDFLILISVSMIIMYFFMIRPQVKKQKDESKFRSEIAKGDKVLTSGGRVFCATALGKNLQEAQLKAYDLVESVSFDGAFYRKDIGNKGMK